jgi:hypothetical protein
VKDVGYIFDESAHLKKGNNWDCKFLRERTVF